MSYEDLVEARAKRVVKEATRVAKGKGKRGWKRKSGTLEAEEDTTKEDTTEEDTAEDDTVETARRGRKRKSAALDAPAPTNKVARISNAPKPASASVIQASRTQIAEDAITLEPWRALVARMY